MKKGNTHAQVSPFVPDRLLGRPLPPPGVEDAVARADPVHRNQPLARS